MWLDKRIECINTELSATQDQFIFEQRVESLLSQKSQQPKLISKQNEVHFGFFHFCLFGNERFHNW